LTEIAIEREKLRAEDFERFDEVEDSEALVTKIHENSEKYDEVEHIRDIFSFD
jgi:hypothetical protein